MSKPCRPNSKQTDEIQDTVNVCWHAPFTPDQNKPKFSSPNIQKTIYTGWRTWFAVPFAVFQTHSLATVGIFSHLNFQYAKKHSSLYQTLCWYYISVTRFSQLSQQKQTHIDIWTNESAMSTWYMCSDGYAKILTYTENIGKVPQSQSSLLLLVCCMIALTVWCEPVCSNALLYTQENQSLWVSYPSHCIEPAYTHTHSQLTQWMDRKHYFVFSQSWLFIN